MASPSTNQPTIAFFGATGGCTSKALALALQSGHRCTALVRNEPKLRSILSEQHQLPSTLLTAPHLILTQGDIRDVDAVSRALLVPGPNPGDQDDLVDIILSGLGSVPVLNGLNPLRPITIADPTICQDGMKAIFDALHRVQTDGKAKKPLLIAISTTGVSSRGRDVPLAMTPLYHWLLAAPHEDKKAMEMVVVDAMTSPSSSAQSPAPTVPTGIRGYVIIRPSLLTDGQMRGREKVRAGWEVENKTEEKPSPAVGYTISRADVGNWIYEELIGKDGDGWVGRMVTLTY